MKKILIILMILLIFAGCDKVGESDSEKAAKLVENKEFFQGYQLYLEIGEKEKAADCLISWQLEMIEKEQVDDNFKSIEAINNEVISRFFENVKNYVQEKGVLSQEQGQFVLDLIENLEYEKEKYYLHQHLINNIKAMLDGSNILWHQKEYEILSYEDYYAVERKYETLIHLDSRLKRKDLKMGAFFDSDKNGIYVGVYQTEEGGKYDKYYINFKPLEDYYKIDYGKMSDGYWFYYLQNNSICRINIDGVVEEIFKYNQQYTTSDYDRFAYFLVDNVVFYTTTIENDEYVIYRIYWPEKRIEKFETGISNDNYNFHFYCPDNNYEILYDATNPEFNEAIDDLRKDMDRTFRLLEEMSGEVLDQDIKNLYLKEMEEKKFNHFENHELVKLVEREYNCFLEIRYTYNFKTQKLKQQYIKDYGCTLCDSNHS